MSWFVCVDAMVSLKVHVVDESLRSELIRYMENYDHPDAEFKESDYSRFDSTVHYEPGGTGSRVLSQPQCEINLEGKTLLVDTIKIQELLSEIINAKPKKLGDTDVYFLYSHTKVLGLRKSEVDQLRSVLPALYEETKEETEEFFDRVRTAWSKNRPWYSDVFEKLELREETGRVAVVKKDKGN